MQTTAVSSPAIRMMKLTPAIHSLICDSAAALLLPGRAFWPYFTGAVLLVIGLAVISREARGVPGSEKAILFGRLFFALPMGVFAADHFIGPHEIAGMIPNWIPGHMFWAYFVGCALLAASLSIILKRYSVLSSALLGLMFLLFVVLMHIPDAIATPHDRFAWAILLRDLSFGMGAFAFAVSQATLAPATRQRMVLVLRSVLGVTMLVFAAEHFLHPQYVPVIPLEQPLPAWIPAHGLIAYLTGLALIACGVCVLLNWHSRRVAAWTGVYVLAIVLLVYVPMMIGIFFGAVHGLSYVDGLNYVTDTLVFSGVLLLLAGALPEEELVIRSGMPVGVMGQVERRAAQS